MKSLFLEPMFAANREPHIIEDERITYRTQHEFGLQYLVFSIRDVNRRDIDSSSCYLLKVAIIVDMSRIEFFNLSMAGNGLLVEHLEWTEQEYDEWVAKNGSHDPPFLPKKGWTSPAAASLLGDDIGQQRARLVRFAFSHSEDQGTIGTSDE